MIGFFSELRYKEVIDIHSGLRLGYVCDAEYDDKEGRLLSLITPGRAKLFGLMGREDDYVLHRPDRPGHHPGGFQGTAGPTASKETVLVVKPPPLSAYLPFPSEPEGFSFLDRLRFLCYTCHSFEKRTSVYGTKRT